MTHSLVSSDGGLPRGAGLLLLVCLLLWCGIWFGAGAGALISEDYVHWAIAKDQASLREAFDLARVPLRPLQHAAFWFLAHLERPAPLVARSVGLAGHLVAILAVFALGRRWASGAWAGVLAAVLFALAPNVASALSPAALAWPWRVALSLVSLVLFERYARDGSLLAGFGMLAAWGLAMGFHQGALIVPGIVVLRILFLGGERGRVRLLFAPGTVLWCALAVAYVAYMLFVREASGHGLKEVASLPANFVRASLALFPEPLRIWAVAGLREGGTAGWAVGGGILAFAATFVGVAFVRGSRLTRFVILAVALEFALPVLTTGFAARYAYLASGLAAIALGAAAVRVPRSSLARACFVFVALIWSADLAQATFEFRAATSAASGILESARRVRSEVGATPVAIVDVPERWGQEQELQYFGIGLARALELHEIEGPWIVWRTWANFHTTDVYPMTPEEVARRESLGELVVLRWNPSTKQLDSSP